jgi:hypothetical protein
MGKIITLPPRKPSNKPRVSTNEGNVIALPKRRWINLQQLALLYVQYGFWPTPITQCFHDDLRSEPEADPEMVTVADFAHPHKPCRCKADSLQKTIRHLRHECESHQGIVLRRTVAAQILGTLRPRKLNGRWVVASDELEVVLRNHPLGLLPEWRG